MQYLIKEIVLVYLHSVILAVTMIVFLELLSKKWPIFKVLKYE